MFQCLYPLLGALIGRRTLSCSIPEESSSREPVFPFLQHSEHWHYASVHQESSPTLQMTPTDLKTLDTPSEASLSRIYLPIDPWSSLSIPSNLHWFPIKSFLIWHLSITCQSNDCAWLPYGLWRLPCHQYDSLPFAFLASYSTTDSLPYQACWLICLLILAYPLLSDQLQSPYCSLTNPLQSLLLPPFLFEILCFPHVHIKPLKLRGAQEESPPQ